MPIYKDIPLEQIKPDPDQPRKVILEEPLEELANSIAAIGVKQAITVREISTENYMIIAGERRYRASLLAKKEAIPALIITEDESLNDEALFSHQLSENLHRENLNPVEKAEFIQKRIEQLKTSGITNPNEMIADELGVSKGWVSKALKPLKIGEDLRKLAQKGLVKDYAILKKVDALKGDKRQSALEQINSGQFNSKEFFKKKRKPKTNEATEQKKVVTKEDVKSITVKLNITTLKAIIEKTDFIHSLNTLPEEERNIIFEEKPKEIFNQFTSWAEES